LLLEKFSATAEKSWLISAVAGIKKMDFVRCNACGRVFSDENCLHIHIFMKNININDIHWSFDNFPSCLRKKE